MAKKQIKCPICLKEPANISPAFGILPGEMCQEEHDSISTNEYLEFTSDSIKSERKEYHRSMLQPYVGGVLSKEYIEEYGTGKLANVTAKDIKNAKYTNQHLPRWHKRGESKK